VKVKKYCFTITTYCFAAFCQHEIKYVLLTMMTMMPT